MPLTDKWFKRDVGGVWDARLVLKIRLLVYDRLNLRLLRRVLGDNGIVVWLLLFVIVPNSLEMEEDTDVDLTDSVLDGVGSAININKKNSIS